jgi:chromosomal replication initiation ATPase DnaA
VLGIEEFVRRIREKYLEERKADRDLPSVREFEARTTPEEIERVVDRVFRKYPALARKINLYLCHSYTAQNLKEIGIRFDIRESGVSQESCRLRESIGRDCGLKKKIDAIRTELDL